MSDGALNYALALNSSGFSGPLTTAGGSVNAFSSKLGTLGSSLGSAASALGGFAVRAAAVAGPLAGLTGGIGAVAIAMKSLSGAADMESITVSMGVLVGGTENANALLRELREMGSATPYEFPALATGAQTMLAFGIETAEILPLISMLGDISMGSADKLSSLTLVLGQVASAGRLTGGDLFQFINAGFNPLNLIAEKTGESMGDLRKRMEEGAVSFAEVRDAMVAATSAGGDYFGMTDKMSQTTHGLVSTLKDEVNALFLAFGQPVNDALKPILIDAIAKVSELKPAIEAVGEAAATGLSRVYAAATTGQLGALLQAELLVVGAHFLNFLGKGLHEAVKGTAVIGNYIADALSGAGKILEGVLLSAAGTFTSAIADALATLFESNSLTAGFGKKIRESFDNTELESQSAAASKEGTGALASAWEKLVNVGMGSSAVSDEKLNRLEGNRNNLRFILDEQVKAEAEARGKAAAEAEALAAEEAECAAAAAEHTSALNRATGAAEAAGKALPATPALVRPPAGAVAAAAAAAQAEEAAVSGRFKNADQSRASRFARMSRADQAQYAGGLAEFEKADKGLSALDYLRDTPINSIKSSDLLTRSRADDARAGRGSLLDAAAADSGRALAEGSRLARGAGATINPRATALGESNRAAREKPDPNRDLVGLLKKIEEHTAAFADLAVA